MIKKLRVSAAIAVILLAISCGGGGGSGSPAPTPPSGSTDDDARRAVLADIGEKLILPTLRDVDTRAAALKAAVDALAAAPAGAPERTAAQAAWRTAMASVQRAEVLQIGPAAALSEPGGQGLQTQIYSFPQFDACVIHGGAYADLAVDAASPGNRIGMGALEYLLFSDADNPTCPPSGGIDGRAKRAQYAARVATRIGAVVTQLRTAWEPTGGNFVGQFKTAGVGSAVYAVPQDALNAISVAIFYFEKTTKDRKVAAATGIGAVGLADCVSISCPEFLESPYARASGTNVQANLQAFREIFAGADGGLGLNDLMEGAGRSDLVTRFATMLDAASAGVTAGITPDMESNVTGIASRNACLQASISRAGAPAVCAMHGKIDDVTDTLRAEIVSTLNLKIPDTAAGDND